MLFRQKIVFFVFGCVFVIVGQVVTGLVVPSATAQGGLQDATFDTVTVRRLRVLDADGAERVVVGENEKDLVRVGFYVSGTGGSEYAAGIGYDGRMTAYFGQAGESGSVMELFDTGISMMGPGGIVRLSVYDEEGGRLSISSVGNGSATVGPGEIIATAGREVKEAHISVYQPFRVRPAASLGVLESGVGYVIP